MIALQIEHVKEFMNKLLLSDAFDHFLVSEASITTFTTFNIEGEYRKEFFDRDLEKADEAISRSQVIWEEIRPICLSIIKGKRTPLSFKFVFQLPEKETELLLHNTGLPLSTEDVFGLYLNCQFRSDSLTLTTGSSLKVFSLDKTLDQAWDHMLQEFLRAHGLD